jgi:hypothetical protein
MAAGIATANARTARCVVAWKSTIPRSRFQPACRLGNAAYLFVRAGGWRARYPFEYSVTVSTTPGSAIRGGATGTPAKKRKPMSPEMNIALRSSTYRSWRQT